MFGCLVWVDRSLLMIRLCLLMNVVCLLVRKVMVLVMLLGCLICCIGLYDMNFLSSFGGMFWFIGVLISLGFM